MSSQTPHDAPTPTGSSSGLPALPLTIDGSSVLHQMVVFNWAEWRAISAEEQQEILDEAIPALTAMEGKNSALFSLLGHKGDLMLVHFRDSFDALNQVELDLTKLRLNDFLEVQTSFLSVVELGLYESTVKLYRELAEKGFVPQSAEWNAAIKETLARQKEAMRPRIFPTIPDARYICFYPMDRKRGETKNWYTLPIEERQRQMHEHGMIGRRYADDVRQIITGAIGFDDWEWGVDLFAEDPLVFKRLIYEMRWDEVSAVYALFGDFFVGMRFHAKDFEKWAAGELPAK